MILQVSDESDVPIYEQLRNQIVLGIASGQIMPEESLPSVRSLAAELGINHHTVNKTYSILRDEGYITLNRRNGAVVAKNIPDSNLFHQALNQKLSLAAAEAVCHKMPPEEFAKICSEHYNNAKKNGG